MFGSIEKVEPLYHSFESRADDVRKLLDYEPFKKLILEEYINRYITANGVNFVNYPDEIKTEVVREISARSSLHKFLSQVLIDEEVAQAQNIEMENDPEELED